MNEAELDQQEAARRPVYDACETGLAELAETTGNAEVKDLQGFFKQYAILACPETRKGAPNLAIVRLEDKKPQPSSFTLIPFLPTDFSNPPSPSWENYLKDFTGDGLVAAFNKRVRMLAITSAKMSKPIYTSVIVHELYHARAIHRGLPEFFDGDDIDREKELERLCDHEVETHAFQLKILGITGGDNYQEALKDAKETIKTGMNGFLGAKKTLYPSVKKQLPLLTAAFGTSASPLEERVRKQLLQTDAVFALSDETFDPDKARIAKSTFYRESVLEVETPNHPQGLYSKLREWAFYNYGLKL